jgi:hypothetical protein
MEVANMSEKMISRRGAFSLLGLAALGFAVPTTVLTTSNAEAQHSQLLRRQPLQHQLQHQPLQHRPV